MLHNKQKAISGILIIIVVTIVMLGYSYSFVSAVSSQRSVDHHNALVKKRFSGSNSHDGSSSKDNDNGDGRSGNSDRSASGSHKTLDHRHDSSSIGSSINDKSSSSSGLDRKSSSDNSIKEGNNNDQNSDQGTDDRSNTLGTDNNLQSTTRGGQQGTGHNTPSIKTVTPMTPQTACEQGSNCVSHQQESNNHDHSTIATTNTSKKDNTPFVLSLPFP